MSSPVPGAPVPSSSTSDEQVLDQAGGGPSPVPPDETSIPPDDEDGEEDPERVEDEGEEEEEEEEDEEDEEKEEEVSPDKPPSLKEIKAKYPDLFKEFPQLRFAYYRDFQYAQIFPTVNEAKEAASQVTFFNGMEEELLNGNPLTLIKSLKDIDSHPEALKNFARNFLGKLYELDNKSYLEATLPIVKNMIRTAISEGKRTGNKNLENSGRLISKQIFGTLDPPVESRKTLEDDPEKQQLRKELDERNQQDRVSFRGEVEKTLDKSLIASLSKDLDPKGALTPRMKSLLLRDIINEVGQQLEQNPEHLKYMDGLWAQAKRARYDRTWVARISNAYLARAKPILSKVRDKALKETIHGLAPAEDARGPKPPTKKVIPGGRDVRGQGRPAPKIPNSMRDVKQNLTDEEIIAGGNRR